MKAHSATCWLLALGLCTAASAQPTAAPAAASAPLVKPGLWETTTVTEDSATTRRSVVGRTCVNAIDAARAERFFPIQHGTDMQCGNHDVRQDGTAWTWTVSCRSATATRVDAGRMVLSADSYLGRVGIELREKGAKAVKVRQTFSGKWLQPCT